MPQPDSDQKVAGQTLLSRTQRLRLVAAHEDCRDDLDLVELSLSVQISRLEGPAAAEVGQPRGLGEPPEDYLK